MTRHHFWTAAHNIVVGWDHQLESFFAWVRTRRARPAVKDAFPTIVDRCGVNPKAVPTLEELQEWLRHYAEIPEEIQDRLRQDYARHSRGEEVVSRHKYRTEVYLVMVGWDDPLQTFFAQVWEREPKHDLLADEHDPVLWVGTERGEVLTIRELEAHLRRYAKIPADVQRQLQRDFERRKEPTPLQRHVAGLVEGRQAAAGHGPPGEINAAEAAGGTYVFQVEETVRFWDEVEVRAANLEEARGLAYEQYYAGVECEGHDWDKSDQVGIEAIPLKGHEQEQAGDVRTLAAASDFRVEELPGQGTKFTPLTPRAREHTYGESVDGRRQRWHESGFVLGTPEGLREAFSELRSLGFRFEQPGLAGGSGLAGAAPSEKLTDQEKGGSTLVLLPGGRDVWVPTVVYRAAWDVGFAHGSAFQKGKESARAGNLKDLRKGVKRWQPGDRTGA